MAKNYLYLRYNDKGVVMKVSLNDKLTFNGYKPVKDDLGRKNYEFNYVFDEDAFDCYLEIYNVSVDKNGNYIITDRVDNYDTKDGMLKLKSGANKVNLSSSYFLSEKTPFAYHYKLVDKDNNEYFRVDAGNIVDKTKEHSYEIYNVVTQNGSNLNHGGSMKLVIPDNYNVGWQYNKKLFDDNHIIKNNEILNKAIKSHKHFSNKVGGTLAGIEKGLENGDFDGYTNIVSLPLFTDDSLSAHGYWNKNCMQISQPLGNINNYISLQKKLFGKGINLVSDGAFVNEGLEGIHLASVLKWGEKSPYFNWFRASGLKNGPFMFGVFGKNKDIISHKLVNSPYNFEQNENGHVSISRNRNYDSSKPTYIQIFDNRLASEKQKNDTQNLIETYDILNTDNPYEINVHDDTVINYHFEIDPEIYKKNVINLNEYNKSADFPITLKSYDGTRFVSKFENFELEDKIESNFETWDANTDIAKLNYVYSHSDTENGKNLNQKQRTERENIIKEGNCQVKDYIITSGKYWTQKTKDILTLYAAQNLINIEKDNPKKVLDTIKNKVTQGIFPQKLDINEEVVKNVLNGDYLLNQKSAGETFDEQVKAGIMNLPLDTIEFGDNIAEVLASPYITNRAIHEDEIGLTKYELYKKGNPHLTDETERAYLSAQKLYDNELFGFAKEILGKVQGGLEEKLDNPEYGKYVIPIMTSEIVKFALVKALAPDVKVYVNKENGEIGYDYEALKKTSLQGLGIYGASPEDEALSLIHKIKKGVIGIGENDKNLLADALKKSLKGTNASSFALAEMIVDRSQAGLDWRIDATKDVADIDALRDKKNSFADAWEEVTDFWKNFTQNILKINSNSFITAEVTDEVDLHKEFKGHASRFSQNEITKKLLNETGMTSTANYSAFFTDLAMLFGKSFTHENCMEYPVDDYFQKRIFEKMIGKEDYLRSSNMDSLLYSYTFIGNHDKPRALHCFALDMGLFFCDLTDKKNSPYRELAYRILNDKLYGEVKSEEIDKFNFDTVSPKAIAMADAMIRAFGDAFNKLCEEDNKLKSDEKYKNSVFEKIIASIIDLAKGSYLGNRFNADAFGVKPFDVVIDTVIKQAQEVHGLDLDDKKIKELKDTAFQNILAPAYSKLLGAMKYLVALPGKPTLYAGDDLGSTGYEEKTKNIYLANRYYIHNEWKDNEFIKKYNDELAKVMKLRSRSELDALNNGAPYTLPLQYSHEGTKLSAILRQNTEGKMAISLFNTAGIHHNPALEYTPTTVYLDKISLNEDGDSGKIGLKGGLKEGAKFVNANDENDVYYVHKYGNEYCIEHHDKSPICVNDSTMILYHVPEVSQVAFLGRVDFKPQNVEKAYSLA